MPDLQRLKRRVAMLETIGRKSLQPRRTALGGQLIGDEFWMVSEHGEHSHYVLNIKADPAMRLLPGVNSALVRLMGSDLLTIRVDVD
jgi:deazaflavin-dependent oxidoreductase (nitroreductase family)